MIMQSFYMPVAVGYSVMAAVFAILVIVYYQALGAMFVGRCRSRFPLAVAAALLSVLGIFGTGARQAGDQAEGWFPTVLLPYEALGFTVLLLPLVLPLACFWLRRRARSASRRNLESRVVDEGFVEKSGTKSTTREWSEPSRER